jgi:hypothetical protein
MRSGISNWCRAGFLRAGVGIGSPRTNCKIRMARRFLAARRALEAAGVEFIDENGGGAGVRLRKPVGGKSGQ